jgi:hypothetical protein
MKPFLPLSQVQWRNSKTGHSHTLEKVELNFIPAEKTFAMSLIPVNWYLKPFVHMLLIQTEVKCLILSLSF